jgi:hypothetical protein
VHQQPAFHVHQRTDGFVDSRYPWRLGASDGPFVLRTFRGLAMAIRSGNTGDLHSYQAAEDAFTSEGGHLAPDDEVVGKRVDANGPPRPASRDFRNAMKRYAAGMRAVLNIFRAGGSRATARSILPSVVRN